MFKKVKDSASTKQILIFLAVLLLVGSGVAFAATQYWGADPGIELSIENDDGQVTGPHVTLAGSEKIDISSTDVRPENNTIALGNASFTSADASYVTITNAGLHGDTTSVTEIDAGEETLYIDSNVGHRVGVNNNISSVSFTTINLNERQATEISVTGTGELSINNLNTEYVRVISTAGDRIVPVDSSVATLSVSNEDITLAETSSPTFSNASPVDDAMVSEAPAKLEVGVRHPDFEANETVDLQFNVNDEPVGTKTASSNGTYSVTTSDVLSGTNNWSVEASDTHGSSASLDADNITFRVPANLSVYDEQAPESKITTNGTAEVLFFPSEGEERYSRTIENGTVSMQGIPADTSFVAVVSLEDYRDRRIYVESIFEQQRMYALKNNAEIVEPAFRITDFTNDYPTRDTVIKIKRNFGDGWTTVEGDYFGGSNQVGAQLEYNSRYRIVIENIETGQSRNLGAYTPTASNVIDLEVFATDEAVEQTVAPNVDVTPGLTRIPSRDAMEMSFNVSEGDMDLEAYEIRVQNGSGAVIETLEGTGPGDRSIAVNTTAHEGGQVEVVFNWTAADGTTQERTAALFDVARGFDNDGALIPALLSVGDSPAGTPPGPTQGMLALVSALAATGFAARRLSSGAAGLVGLGVLGIATLVGFFATTWLFAAAITWVVLSGLQKRV